MSDQSPSSSTGKAGVKAHEPEAGPVFVVRRFGTNNFPHCSNMRHEATSVGLPESIGIGKGAVVLEDFATTDAIFIIGRIPARIARA
jgi:anaerobic selenocysteine-containing dehydrogenase